MLENFSEVVTYENLEITFDSSFEQITKNFTFSPVILCSKTKIQVIALACLYRLDFSQNSTISKILGNLSTQVQTMISYHIIVCVSTNYDIIIPNYYFISIIS